jgi:hypothetical protein
MTSTPDDQQAREPLIGYMIFEDHCDDMSDWSGVITGPQDPTGANLAWESPIKMISYDAYEKLAAQNKQLDERDEELCEEIARLTSELESYRKINDDDAHAIHLLTRDLTKAKELLGECAGVLNDFSLITDRKCSAWGSAQILLTKLKTYRGSE